MELLPRQLADWVTYLPAISTEPTFGLSSKLSLQILPTDLCVAEGWEIKEFLEKLEKKIEISELDVLLGPSFATSHSQRKEAHLVTNQVVVLTTEATDHHSYYKRLLLPSFPVSAKGLPTNPA